MNTHQQTQQSGKGTTTVASLGFVAGFGALIGASCCILPLLLAIGGVSGSWIAGIGALTPYQPYLLGLAALCITVGWAIAIRRRMSLWIVAVLAMATLLVLGSVVTAIYERPVTQYLFSVWRDG